MHPRRYHHHLPTRKVADVDQRQVPTFEGTGQGLHSHSVSEGPHQGVEAAEAIGEAVGELDWGGPVRKGILEVYLKTEAFLVMVAGIADVASGSLPL